MLLVIYGATSLWLGKTTNRPDVTRRVFCELWVCAQSDADSPTDITPPPEKSLAWARAELVLSPASAYRWADLADAEINANRIDNGKFCARQALAAAPGNPAILFRVANLYLRLQDYPEALRNLVAVLRNPDLTDYYDRVFEQYSQMDLPLDQLLNKGLPHTPQTANAFLRFWVDQGQLDEAQTTWAWINANALTSIQSAGSYVALLAKDGRWDEALDSWSHYTAQLEPNYRQTNWVYNGSFEMQPVECPFDWHLTSGGSIEVVRDLEPSYKGNASLHLKFSATPKDSTAQAFQMAMLKPGKWEIKAAMKTLGLTSGQGVVIRIIDADDPSRLDIATNTFQRTQEWTPVTAVFDISGSTRRVRVEIMRPPARDLDIQLVGQVWIDAVQLIPVE